MREKNANKYKDLEYINPSANTETWENFSLQCPFRVQDQYGNAICTYHEDCPGECKPINCPFLDEDMKAELESGEELLKCVIRVEVVA